MPISRAGPLFKAGLFAAVLALSACIDGGASLGPPQFSVASAGGAVTIAGPGGYCVDRQLSRVQNSDSFVVLGSCAALAEGGVAPAGAPAILTATVSGAPASAVPGPAALETFLRSEDGRRTLARDNRAESVTILRTRSDNGTLMLNIRDTSPGGIGRGTEDAYWRAVFAVRDRLVTATVLAFSERPLTAEGGFRLLGRFVARIRAVNPGPAG